MTKKKSEEYKAAAPEEVPFLMKIEELERANRQLRIEIHHLARLRLENEMLKAELSREKHTRKLGKKFKITFSGDLELTARDIWGQQTPTNPSAEDVISKMMELGSKDLVLGDWNLCEDIVIHVEAVDDPKDEDEW